MTAPVFKLAPFFILPNWLAARWPLGSPAPDFEMKNEEWRMKKTWLPHVCEFVCIRLSGIHAVDFYRRDAEAQRNKGFETGCRLAWAHHCFVSEGRLLELGFGALTWDGGLYGDKPPIASLRLSGLGSRAIFAVAGDF